MNTIIVVSGRDDYGVDVLASDPATQVINFDYYMVEYANEYSPDDFQDKINELQSVLHLFDDLEPIVKLINELERVRDQREAEEDA